MPGPDCWQSLPLTVSSPIDRLLTIVDGKKPCQAPREDGDWSSCRLDSAEGCRCVRRRTCENDRRLAVLGVLSDLIARHFPAQRVAVQAGHFGGFADVVVRLRQGAREEYALELTLCIVEQDAAVDHLLHQISEVVANHSTILQATGAGQGPD